MMGKVQFLQFSVILICLLILQNCNGNKVEESTSAEAIVEASFDCEQLGEDEMGIPRSKLFAIIDDKRLEVGPMMNCEALPAEEFSNYNIPKEAKAAVFGYWAGGGDCYYLTVNGSKARIYSAFLDEMSDEGLRFEMFGVYQNGKFVFR